MAAADIICCSGVLRFISFGIIGDDPVPLWCDNEACVLVAHDASSIKRLSYVARRVRFLQELVSRNFLCVLNVPGKANPADVLTKHIGKSEFREYMARLYNTSALNI